MRFLLATASGIMISLCVETRVLFILVFAHVSLKISFHRFRTLFKDTSGNLDKNARFSAVYRQDSNKLSNDDMLKLLADFRK